VGILEDDEVLCRGIVAILSEQSCSCVVLDGARDVSEAAHAKAPLDVAVVCSKSARDLELPCPVILLTAPMLFGQASRRMTSKVMATLPHDGLTVDQLVASVRAAAAGLRVEDASSGSASEPILDLRRIEVLRLLATGATTRAVARELHLSERTVKTLVHDIQLSLGTSTRAQAAAEAVRLGLI
jgi:DNA-binding NarL/FixJ family response regulator